MLLQSSDRAEVDDHRDERQQRLVQREAEDVVERFPLHRRQQHHQGRDHEEGDQHQVGLHRSNGSGALNDESVFMAGPGIVDFHFLVRGPFAAALSYVVALSGTQYLMPKGSQNKVLGLNPAADTNTVFYDVSTWSTWRTTLYEHA